MPVEPNQLFSECVASSAFVRTATLVPRIPGDATKFLDGDLDFETVSGGSGVVQQASVTLSSADLIALAGGSTEFLAGIIGKLIVINFAILEYKPGTTPFTSLAAAPLLYLARTSAAASIIADPLNPPGANNWFIGETLFGDVSLRQGLHLDTLTAALDQQSIFSNSDMPSSVSSGISLCMTAGDALADGDGEVKITIFYVVDIPAA